MIKDRGLSFETQNQTLLYEDELATTNKICSEVEKYIAVKYQSVLNWGHYSKWLNLIYYIRVLLKLKYLSFTKVIRPQKRLIKCQFQKFFSGGIKKAMDFIVEEPTENLIQTSLGAYQRHKQYLDLAISCYYIHF